MLRFEEEEGLLLEEMRRYGVFCQCAAGQWLARATIRTGLSAPLAAGLHAYANRQASFLQKRVEVAAREWGSVRAFYLPDPRHHPNSPGAPIIPLAPIAPDGPNVRHTRNAPELAPLSTVDGGDDYEAGDEDDADFLPGLDETDYGVLDIDE